MTRLLVIAVLSLGSVSVAQEHAGPLPAQFSVTNVAAGDQLNIRAEPSAEASILDSYPPYALNIEVLAVSPDGLWGLVGVPESNGWVAMRFLERQPLEFNTIPRPVACYGTEPFWSLNVTVRGDEFASTELPYPSPLNLSSEEIAPNGFLAVFEEGPTLNHTLIVQRGYCGDGMSDREFGLRATLFTAAPDGNDVRHGCCTLDGNR